MALHTLKDYYPNHQDEMGNSELKNIDSYDVYTEGDDKVGSIKDILVDDSGRFRYAIVDTGPWIFGKNVLLPIGLANFDYSRNRVYVNGLSRQQIENLPEYKREQIVDDRYEEQVREQYRPIAQRRSSRQFMGQTYGSDLPVENTQPVEGPVAVDADVVSTQRNMGTQRNTAVGKTAYDYDREPHFYGFSAQDNQGPLQLFEERLIAKRHREKVGEVRVGKRVVTETAEIAEPVEKERVVIERHAAEGQPAAGTQHAFNDQEVARMDVYEEQVDIEKQPFVKENVTVRKETDRETVRAKEQVRREELDVDTTGNPNISKGDPNISKGNRNPRTR